ncbi:Variant SH3 domain [Phytophthora infestans]|uniref:Variant SH3 domain n=1 Tax=Phytophthora infestans TaxID=4787 RepID=A0A833RZX2_PHYIN|nr:Variant SH3 domain [Phytophthora infestans]KAF4150446.1 Variant SH3 domain [Phytophthora infestans]
MGELRRDRKWSMQVTALYDYEPERIRLPFPFQCHGSNVNTCNESDELRFIEGDVLRVLQVQDDGWWSGYNVESPDVIGIFPSNYVQALRTVFKMQSAKSLVDAGRTPRPPASSRQRIELQFRQGFATLEIEDGDEDDKVEETRTDNRGAILLLRQNLEQAERASQAVRDARRQAERERRRHRKCWRERGHDEDTDEEEHLGQHAVDVNHNGNEDDTEDEEETAPQLQGDMHVTKCQEADEGQVDKISDTIEKKGGVQTGEEFATKRPDAETTAANVIIRAYRRHAAVIQNNCERARNWDQRKLSMTASARIQRWVARAYSRQRTSKRKTALRREKDAATTIQKWARLRWAYLWCRRVQIKRAKREVQQARERIKMQQLRREAGNGCRQLTQRSKQEEEQRRNMQQSLDK